MPYYSKSTNRGQEFYFVGLLAIWLLAGCAGYSSCVLYSAEMSEALSLASSFSPDQYRPNNTQAAIEHLRPGLGVAASMLGIGGAILVYNLRRRGQLGYDSWPNVIQRATAWLIQAWQMLLPRQKCLAVAAFAFLTVLRIVVSQLLVTVDDSASYEFFVRKSLLTVSSYYPAPNNHVFSNTLSWLFYQVYPGFWWSMRVPVLLASTVATAYWFLGLLHRSSFRVAVLAVMLFSLLELSLFSAVEGRGYALLLGLSALGFFSVLSFTEMDGSIPKLVRAWTGMAVAGIVGVYTVPTFAYFLVAAYSWLVMHFVRNGNLSRLVSVGLLGTITLAGSALLYAPLLLISGPKSLFQNVYVIPLEAATFFKRFPAYLWETEGILLGESRNGVLASIHLGSMAAVAVVIGFLALVWAAHKGRLPMHKATYIIRVGIPALWFTSLPYILLVMQRVEAPTRTLGFKAVFTFLLIGLELDWILHQYDSKIRYLRTALCLGIAMWAAIQVAQLYRSNELRLSYLRTPHLAAQWLLTQPPGPVLALNSQEYLMSLRFYIHFEKPASSLEIDSTPRPGIRYRYIINPPATLPAPSSAVLPHLHIDRDVNSEAMDITAYW